jgi:hypothetical protein
MYSLKFDSYYKDGACDNMLTGLETIFNICYNNGKKDQFVEKIGKIDAGLIVKNLLELEIIGYFQDSKTKFTWISNEMPSMDMVINLKDYETQCKLNRKNNSLDEEIEESNEVLPEMIEDTSKRNFDPESGKIAILLFKLFPELDVINISNDLFLMNKSNNVKTTINNLTTFAKNHNIPDEKLGTFILEYVNL